MKPQIPIRMDVSEKDTAKQIVGKWARAIKSGATQLEGPAYLMCFDCFHKGPSVDCTGRTSEDVARDKAVYDEMKRLWNTQVVGVGAKS